MTRDFHDSSSPAGTTVSVKCRKIVIGLNTRLLDRLAAKDSPENHFHLVEASTHAKRCRAAEPRVDLEDLRSPLRIEAELEVRRAVRAERLGHAAHLDIEFRKRLDIGAVRISIPEIAPHHDARFTPAFERERACRVFCTVRRDAFLNHESISDGESARELVFGLNLHDANGACTHARFDDEREADALNEGGLLSWEARVGCCEPMIAKETVGQVLVIGDPHDVWIADDHVSSEPLLPARAVLGEKEELEIRAGNDRIGALAVEDVLEGLHVRRIARHRNEVPVARPVEARREWVRVGGHDDGRQRRLHQRSDDSLTEQSSGAGNEHFHRWTPAEHVLQRPMRPGVRAMEEDWASLRTRPARCPRA